MMQRRIFRAGDATAPAGWLGLLACLLPWAIAAQTAPVSPIDFDRQIRPVLQERCVSCHGAEKQKGSLRLDQKSGALRGGSELGPAILPGRGEDSPLIKVINGDLPDLLMPQKGEKLSPETIALLRAWIDQGAAWPEGAPAPARPPHWSFQPVRRPPLPAAVSASMGANPIDRFIQDKLRQAGLKPGPQATRDQLIRRLSFDLVGLPPTPEAVVAFEHDRRPDAYERWVDQLLNSPRHGERWARHWLDVVRFAETHGFEMNQPRPNAWPYRDYVIRAFNEDKPYNQFVLEQMAGDVLGADEATGFLVAGPWDQVKSPDVVLTSNQRADELHDMISTVGTAFLGLTLGCARCHEHKFDPVPQRDYYAIKAVLEGVQHGDRPWRPPGAEGRAREAETLKRELAGLDKELAVFERPAYAGRTLVMDEEVSAVGQTAPRVRELIPMTAKGEYPAGSARGERDDAGDAKRAPTFTPSYRAWNKVAGKDVMAWEPGVAGRFRVYLSWGSGWNTHARDAVYVLDRDGDLATATDQLVLAKVDQRKFADGTGEVPGRPLWSGFLAAGIHEFQPGTRIVLRGGATDEFVSADVLVLQEVVGEPAARDLPELRSAVQARENRERFAATSARRLRLTIESTNGGEPCLDELEVYAAGAEPRNVALASLGTKASASGTYAGSEFHKLEHINDGQHGNARSWISNEAGRGWVELEFPSDVTIDQVVWGRDREEKYRDRLATRYRIEVANAGGPWRTVASSDDRLPYRDGRVVDAGLAFTATDAAGQRRLGEIQEQRQACRNRLRELQDDRRAYAGDFKMPGATKRFHRGDPMQPREEVEPGTLSSIATNVTLTALSPETPEAQRRLALARWMVEPSNPLTPRVIVNRLWQHHFGEGLVSTPSDFGANGAVPTHPELLDWLAAELVEHGWSLRHIHRLIVTSATYRQSSAPQAEAMNVDAGSRLLWRFPPQRLEAEGIRDTILTVSGNLDLRAGGPGFSVFEPNDNYVRVYTPRQQFGTNEWRRMIYSTQVRQRLDGVFGVFDCPDGGQSAPRRTRSTTPLQALNLLNSGFIGQQAEIFARRLEKEAGRRPAAQVRRAFALAFQREPTAKETRAAEAFIAAQGLPAFCRVMFNANEFVHVY